MGWTMTDKKQEKLQNENTWDWDRAEARPGRKRPRAVVSVAFSRDDFEAVSLSAERAHMRVSEFIRSAVLGCAQGNYLVVVTSGGSPNAGSMGYLPAPSTSTRVATTPVFNTQSAEAFH